MLCFDYLFICFYRALHNILIEQINVVDEQLKNKTHALDVEQKCLQYRVQLDGRSCS